MKRIKRIPYSLRWDWKWLAQTNIPFFERAGFVLRKYRALLTGRRHIKYLGTDITYDNVNSPMTLESYPFEINLLHREIDLDRGCAVLDIGANIGQFSITLGTLFPSCEMFAFEANPEIFHFLERNTASLPNVQIFNTAIGPQGKLPFYYVADRSAAGSFLKQNIGAGARNDELHTLEIDVVELTPENCQSMNIPQEYDLIKIDVEGYEYELLLALKGIRTRYLYIEFSNARARECGYEMIDLFRRIEELFGRFSVVSCDRISPELSMGNMLIKCVNSPVEKSEGSARQDAQEKIDRTGTFAQGLQLRGW
ncbi:MAG: FkbM family methyltransferase [Thiogranum sp.]|nr:FkbM family methyltransferase [Thiogranum sp.]